MLKLHNSNDLGKGLDPLDEGVFDNRAEPFGKAQELRGRQRLIAKEDHAVFEPARRMAPTTSSLSSPARSMPSISAPIAPAIGRTLSLDWAMDGFAPRSTPLIGKKPNTAWPRRKGVRFACGPAGSAALRAGLALPESLRHLGGASPTVSEKSRKAVPSASRS